MKKIIGALLIFLCFSVFHADYALGQGRDTTVTKYDNSEEVDDQDAAGQKTNTTAVCRHIALGIEGGLNVAYLTTNINTAAEYSGNASIAARLGLILDIPLVGGLYLQPGLFYAMNGGNVAISNEWNINTLEVPVNLIYKFRMRDVNAFFIGAGPYMGYNVSATQTGGTLSIGSDGNDDLKALDFGVGVNIGCELNSGFLLRIRYQEGFYNLQPVSEFATINSSSYGLQVGYFFGRKGKHTAAVAQHPEQRVWDQ